MSSAALASRARLTRRRCSSCAASARSFPASRRSTTCRFDAPRRRSPYAARRERRRQIDADEDPVRRLPRRRRRDSAINGEPVDDPRPARRADARHRRHLPGVHARPPSRHRRRTSSSAASRRAACPASSTAADSTADAKRVLDAIGFDIDPRQPCRTARRRAAADGRDRQGAVARTRASW